MRIVPQMLRKVEENSLNKKIKKIHDDVADASKYEQLAEFFKLMGILHGLDYYMFCQKKNYVCRI